MIVGVGVRDIIQDCIHCLLDRLTILVYVYLRMATFHLGLPNRTDCLR